MQKETREPVKNEKFGNMLGNFVKDVNKEQLDSKQIVNDFINGEEGVELHEVMIAGEKANTSLQLLMELRNKTVDMYKELTRMS
ncbi:MAG: flagellar hook-basal body complex protein FliE [Ignavibacteriae bacterium]|nr:MAG: flagellar hook-basal body complex protein FliE [Ignavibacteriota bacterium]